MKLGIYNCVAGVTTRAKLQIHVALRQRGWSRRTRDLSHVWFLKVRLHRMPHRDTTQRATFNVNTNTHSISLITPAPRDAVMKPLKKLKLFTLNVVRCVSSRRGEAWA